MSLDPTAGQAIGRRWLIMIPIASVMYLLAFFDRTNISFVLPYMGGDLSLTNADKGLVSGIFFIGYLVMQVPAAVLAQRWSAKYTILILMVLWGLAAIWTGLVHSRGELFAARFVLGVVEGGVQPATLVLISKWFPQKEKARASGFWLLCLPISAILAAPLTGFLLGHFSWRTVLVIEGLPPLVWAVVWVALIAERPARAAWLSTTERTQIEDALEVDEQLKAKTTAGSVRYRDVIRNSKVQVLIVAWFLYNAGFYGFTLWLPQVVKTITGGSPQLVGVVTAVPFVLGLAVMILVSVLTDRQGSRRSTVLVPLAVAAVALVAGQFVGSGFVQFALICVVGGGLYIHGAFFALPPLLLRTEILAVGFGLVGGLGNLGGFLGPYLVGWLIDLTGSTATGFLAMAKVTPKRIAADTNMPVAVAAD